MKTPRTRSREEHHPPSTLTILLARGGRARPFTVPLAGAALQAHDVVAVLAGVCGPGAEQTSADGHAAKGNLLRFRTLAVCGTKRKLKSV